MHFEDLWESCEKFFSSNNNESSSEILDKLIHKIGIYKSIPENKEHPVELLKMKTLLFGELLLSLTQLSLKDNINSFTALNSAIKYRKSSK